MNSRLIDDTDDREERLSRGGDREITLGTTMILLIFFALAVYGAALFGFGYSLGSKHNSTTAGVEQAPASSASFNAFKPAPGSPVGAASVEKPPAATETAMVPMTPPPAAVKVDMPVAKAAAETTDSDDAALRARPAPAAAAPVAAPAGGAPSVVPVAGFGTVVVQVAAVSHQEDADLIATTLKRRGYVVNIRTEADKLLHVQVGPFATRKDAETMKAKLLADGFNAYIK